MRVGLFYTFAAAAVHVLRCLASEASLSLSHTVRSLQYRYHASYPTQCDMRTEEYNDDVVVPTNSMLRYR